ncbi:MAG TPA: AAA domain-containing protein [Ohtaekwangia sp.]
MHAAKGILRSYLRRLTNLSGNNRSLLLLRLSAEQLMDVHELSFLNGERSFGIINALIAGKAKKICPVLDSRVEASNEASKKLKKLQRIDKFLFEERGSNDLHVGWPFVEGKFSDGTWVRCPLLFFPVSIVQTGQHWHLEPREDAGITFNKSFLLAYAFYNHIKLEESLIDFTFEDFDSDSTVFRTQVYQLIKDKLEVNFNPDNFRDELQTFRQFKKEEFDPTHRNGEIKLFPEAVLGIFPQAGSQLVPDYQHLLENDSIKDLEDFFSSKSVSTTGEVNKPSEHKVSEEKLLTPFTIDAYQENAVQAIKNGKSIVVQGPPGTGKSQLICNLLADAMASGKRALLVCQKRAALDVVYTRLKSIDLGDFLGLVHDFRNDRREIFSKIATQIERLEEFKIKNRSIDVIQTERKFFQVSRRIDHITEELQEFRNTLFDERECGSSVKALYLTSNPYAPSINIKQEYQYFHFQELPVFIKKLKTYAGFAGIFNHEAHPWFRRKSFAAFQLQDEKNIERIIHEIPAFQKKVSADVFKLIGSTLNLEDCETLFQRADDILGMITVLKDDNTYHFFQSMMSESDDETSLLWLANMERVCMNCFSDENPETTIASDQLGKIQEALQQHMLSRRNIIKLIRWELFSDNKLLVKKVVAANGLEYNKIGLNVLEKRIDSRLNLEHQLTALKGKSWLHELPQGYDKKTLQRWFTNQKYAIRAKLIFNSIREIKDAVSPERFTRSEFIGLLQQILSALKEIPEKKSEWLKYLTPYQIRQLIFQPELESTFMEQLHYHFDALCAYDILSEELKLYERDVITKLHDEAESWDAEGLAALFQNSLRLAWIDHLETKFPVLRMVSFGKMDELQTELQQLIGEKQKLSEEILIVRARERVYEGVEYNRLNNRVTYRDLYHQVTKKKKIWPVRKVIEQFQEELFRLVPCWMASPESVSAIFPMTELFDVVIFDEASQCFAERGIPAMYRGRQIVVAGDAQQLQPSELYQVRWEEEEEAPDLEVDSLLALAERYVSTIHLQGHYRSKSLELIDFSNRFFYEGRLKLLPDRNTVNRNEPAIEYCKVDGVWDNHTNPVEAEMVVERIRELLQDHPDKEIGIVTFNAPQQMLIMDLLEAASARSELRIPSSLFVKNIENVQGDEKDIIIFSVGYAPDKKGKMSMQFGSLNTAGGENRLNVAVTRAREKIILISSIWPEQLKTDDLKNAGPVLFKKYLEFARDVHDRKFQTSVSYNTNGISFLYLNNKIKHWADASMSGFVFENNAFPFSDLSVGERDQYLAIILTDDIRYYQSPSVKDAHAYTPALLTQKNWHYRMIFSRQFWKNPEKIESELKWFVGASALSS